MAKLNNGEPGATRDLRPRTHGIANSAQYAGLGWREIPVPVIAAVHGVAFGGGLQVALGADIRLVTADLKMSVMEIKWGLVPDMGGALLMRTLMRSRALVLGAAAAAWVALTATSGAVVGFVGRGGRAPGLALAAAWIAGGACSAVTVGLQSLSPERPAFIAEGPTLAVWLLLRRRRLPAELKIGVIRREAPFQAHAWVELGGVALDPAAAAHAAFPPLP